MIEYAVEHECKRKILAPILAMLFFRDTNFESSPEFLVSAATAIAAVN